MMDATRMELGQLTSQLSSNADAPTIFASVDAFCKVTAPKSPLLSSPKYESSTESVFETSCSTTLVSEHTPPLASLKNTLGSLTEIDTVRNTSDSLIGASAVVDDSVRVLRPNRRRSFHLSDDFVTELEHPAPASSRGAGSEESSQREKRRRGTTSAESCEISGSSEQGESPDSHPAVKRLARARDSTRGDDREESPNTSRKKSDSRNCDPAHHNHSYSSACHRSKKCSFNFSILNLHLMTCLSDSNLEVILPTSSWEKSDGYMQLKRGNKAQFFRSQDLEPSTTSAGFEMLNEINYWRRSVVPSAKWFGDRPPVKSNRNLYGVPSPRGHRIRRGKNQHFEDYLSAPLGPIIPLSKRLGLLQSNEAEERAAVLITDLVKKVMLIQTCSAIIHSMSGSAPRRQFSPKSPEVGQSYASSEGIMTVDVRDISGFDDGQIATLDKSPTPHSQTFGLHTEKDYDVTDHPLHHFLSEEGLINPTIKPSARYIDGLTTGRQEGKNALISSVKSCSSEFAGHSRESESSESLSIHLLELISRFDNADMNGILLAMEKPDPYASIYNQFNQQTKKNTSESKKELEKKDKYRFLAQALALRRSGCILRLEMQIHKAKKAEFTNVIDSSYTSTVTVNVETEKLKMLRSRGSAFNTRTANRTKAVASWSGYLGTCVLSPMESTDSPGQDCKTGTSTGSEDSLFDQLDDEAYCPTQASKRKRKRSDDFGAVFSSLRYTFPADLHTSDGVEGVDLDYDHSLLGGSSNGYNKRAGRPKVNRAGCKCLLCSTYQTPQWRFMILFEDDPFMDLVCNACYMKFNGSRPHYSRSGKHPPPLPEIAHVEKPQRPSLDEYKVKGPAAFPHLMRRNDSKQFAIVGKHPQYNEPSRSAVDSIIVDRLSVSKHFEERTEQPIEQLQSEESQIKEHVKVELDEKKEKLLCVSGRSPHRISVTRGTLDRRKHRQDYDASSSEKPPSPLLPCCSQLVNVDNVSALLTLANHAFPLDHSIMHESPQESWTSRYASVVDVRRMQPARFSDYASMFSSQGCCNSFPCQTNNLPLSMNPNGGVTTGVPTYAAAFDSYSNAFSPICAPVSISRPLMKIQCNVGSAISRSMPAGGVVIGYAGTENSEPESISSASSFAQIETSATTFGSTHA